MEGSVIYDEACQAGDTAGYVERLSAMELKRLHRHAACLVSQSETKGGIPAVVKWLCILEAAARFLDTRNQNQGTI